MPMASINEQTMSTSALPGLVVGIGNMGASHARAYDEIDGFELAGLCARRIASGRGSAGKTLPHLLATDLQLSQATGDQRR